MQKIVKKEDPEFCLPPWIYQGKNYIYATKSENDLKTSRRDLPKLIVERKATSETVGGVETWSGNKPLVYLNTNRRDIISTEE